MASNALPQKSAELEGAPRKRARRLQVRTAVRGIAPIEEEACGEGRATEQAAGQSMAERATAGLAAAGHAIAGPATTKSVAARRSLNEPHAKLEGAPPRSAAANIPKNSSAHFEESSARRTLARAFERFTEAAGTLERSYEQLQAEVLRLRFELEQTHRDLGTSQQENARMRQYLGRVLESVPCGVVVVDAKGEPRLANPEARRLLDADFADKSDAGVTRAGTARVMAEALRRALRQSVEESRKQSRDEKPAEREHAVETVDGKRTIGIACAVIGDGSGAGAASESVLVLRDLTEEKRRAAEAENVRRRESLAEMATLLAHEIRNPLGSLELFAGLLADATAAQPDLRRWTDHVQAGLRTLSATVNNVLQFHSQPAPQLADVNLGRLVRESVDFLRPLARQGGLRIDLQNALGEVEIPGDAHRLKQVFFNVSLNAFRAMSVGGILSIRLKWADVKTFDKVRMEFEDSGRGIAKENLARIFDAGFTTHPGNPGIGLAVSRTVVEQHSGTIEVMSEPGRGTKFSVTLPRMIAGAAPHEPLRNESARVAAGVAAGSHEARAVMAARGAA